MIDERSRRLWSALGLSLLALLFFHEVVFGGRVFYERDIHLVWYPYLEAVRHSLALGSWPVWNGFISFGEPMWANPAVEVLYPSTWIALLTGPAVGYLALAVGHTILSGIGFLLFARRLSLSPLASFTAAALWMSSGPFVSMVNLWHHFAGHAWLPWVLLATDYALDEPAMRRTVLLGAVVGIQLLAGSADASALSGLMAGSYALSRFAKRDVGTNLRLVSHLALAWGLGVGLAAAQWLPTLELASRAARFHLSAWVGTFWSVHPWMLLQAAIPYRWTDLTFRPEANLSWQEAEQPLFASLYLGMITLSLALCSFVRPQRVQRYFALAATLAAFLALGRYTPVYGIVMKLLPFLRALRYPVKFTAVGAFSVAVLAGMGLDAAGDSEVGRWRRVVLLAAPLTLLAGLGMVGSHLVLTAPGSLAPSLMAWDDPQAVMALLPSLTRIRASSWIAAIALIGVLVAIFRPTLSRGALIAVGALSILDLFLSHEGTNRTAKPEFFRYAPAVVQDLKHLNLGRVWVSPYVGLPDGGRDLRVRIRAGVAPTESARAIAGSLALTDILFPPSGGRWEIEGSYDRDILGLDPDPLGAMVQTVRDVRDPDVLLRLLQIGAVSRVVGFASGVPPDLIPLRTFPSLFEEPVTLFEVPKAVPRCYVVGSALVADGGRAIEAEVDPRFDPTSQVVLAAGTPSPLPPGFLGTCGIESWKPDRMVLQASLSHPGYLVTVDTYDPNWSARVDGQEVSLLRANVAFRAVPVPAGQHSIVFSYRPRALKIGMALSLASALFGVLLARRRGQRR